MEHKHLVIIPTYNEKENIQDILEAVFQLPLPFHVLVIDDGSPDGTASLVKNKQVKYKDRLFLIQRPGKQGLGTAYIAGFKYALEHGYDYIYEMDADFSHNPLDLLALYEACIKNKSDMSIGSRYITGVNVINWPMGRVLMSYLASVYVRIITGLPIQDTTAGFKCYHADVLRVINPDKINFIGYAFQIEMKFAAWKHGFKIWEVPIVFTDRSKGQSKMSRGIFREAVFGVLEMKIKSLFTKYPPLRVSISQNGSI
jgi:dolichol-phosphate mannosyltransferase